MELWSPASTIHLIRFAHSVAATRQKLEARNAKHRALKQQSQSAPAGIGAQSSIRRAYDDILFALIAAQPFIVTTLSFAA